MTEGIRMELRRNSEGNRKELERSSKGTERNSNGTEWNGMERYGNGNGIVIVPTLRVVSTLGIYLPSRTGRSDRWELP